MVSALKFVGLITLLCQLLLSLLIGNLLLIEFLLKIKELVKYII